MTDVLTELQLPKCLRMRQQRSSFLVTMGKLLLVWLLMGACRTPLGQRMIFSSHPSKIELERYRVQSTLIGESVDTTRCRKLTLEIQNRSYELCITEYNVTYTGLLSDQTEIIMQHANHTQSLRLADNFNLTGGYVLHYNGSSYVKGYLNRGRFFGKVQIGDKSFCVEPVRFFRQFDGKFKDDYDAVVFEEPFTKPISTFGLNPNITPDLDYFILNMNPHYGKFYKVNRKSCSLLVAIDNSFIQVIGNGIVDTALPRMILNLDEANSILRSADFDDDGVPDDIGIELKTVLILSSKSPAVGSIIETPIEEAINPKILLKTFTTLEPLKFYCLAILFTAQPFHKRFLGVSFTPSKSVFDRRKLAGICAPWIDLGYSLNTLAITHKLTDGTIMPSSLAELNLAHELAHAFGSDHDSDNCEENFIMQPKAGVPKKMTNLEFSNCSKISISIVLRKQGHCLRENTRAFCGNGIVEEGEECDCGSSTHCTLSDPCCIPRSLPRMCTVKDEIDCHPSQGICCGTNCKFRNLQHLGLNCTNFNSRCPCMQKDRSCNCGVMGTCIGSECHSYDCTRIGLKECLCPKQKDGFCRNCCLLNGKCTLAILATQHMIRDSDVVLEPNRKYSNSKLSLNITLCNSQGVCFELDFRLFLPNAVCILFGKVGICSNSECVTSIGEQQKSTLLLKSRASRCSGINVILICTLYLLMT